jgi:hypothetical protein
MIEHESPERKNYFQRQIDFAVQGNVTEIAAALIVQYQQEGSVDWDQEAYIVEVKPPNHTPEDLTSHAPNGAWNVSACIAASLPTIVLSSLT